MKKIPSLFTREFWSCVITDKPNPECAWVLKGEGVATQKYDGTACMIKDDRLYKRRMVKKGKTPPEDFIKADFDERTGKTVGWFPATDEDKFHLEAFTAYRILAIKSNGKEGDGTYELCGPKIQGNPEHLSTHELISHDKAKQFPVVPRTFTGLKDFLNGMDIEGLIFHHPDGRMAKITKKSFGLKR